MKDEEALTIRAGTREDAGTWATLRTALWPDGAEDHAREIRAFFEGRLEEPKAVFLAAGAPGLFVGLLELSIRRDVPGLEGQPTGYLEGLYVTPEARGGGVARALIAHSRKWAREAGCTALATDRAERPIRDSRYKP